MPKFIYDVSEEQLAVMAEAFCASYGYQAVIGQSEDGSDIPNPVTPNEFVLYRVKLFVEDCVKSYLIEKAKREAIEAISRQIDGAVNVDISVQNG